jgi:hypothetical protein
VPVEAIDEPAGALRTAKVEALVGLGAGSEPAIGHDRGKPAVVQPAGQTIEAVGHQPAAARARPALPASASLRTGEAAAAPKTVEAVPVTGAAAREETRPAESRTAKPEERTERERPRPETPSYAKTTEAARGRVRKPAETKIFIPPRAPDDPGPEVEDADAGLEIGPFRPSGAKA